MLLQICRNKIMDRFDFFYLTFIEIRAIFFGIRKLQSVQI